MSERRLLQQCFLKHVQNIGGLLQQTIFIQVFSLWKSSTQQDNICRSSQNSKSNTLQEQMINRQLTPSGFKYFQEFLFCFINIMNNIRMAAMKAAKSQLNTHASITSNINSDSNHDDEVKKSIENKNLFRPYKVYLENQKGFGFEKPRNHLKHKHSFPCFQSGSPLTLDSFHPHSLYSSQHKQSHQTSRAALGQYQYASTTSTPHTNEEQDQFLHFNSCQSINNTENRYNIKTEGNKIIINPKNNHPLFSQSSRNKILDQESSLLKLKEGSEAKNNFSQASTQHTKDINGKTKQSTKDFEYEKKMRLKKTVFKAPAFLKNRKIALAQQSKKNRLQQNRLKSIPKDFKSSESVCYVKDAGIYKYIQEKAEQKIRRNGRNSFSAEKSLKSSYDQKGLFNILQINESFVKEENIGTFPIGKQISLRILNQAKKPLYANLKILNVLAENESTSVYLVVEKYTSFLYCLKKTELKQSEEKKNQNILDSLIRESKIGMCLDHPLLIKTYCTLLDNRNIYQLMEFVEGSTLQELSRDIKKHAVKQEKPVHSISAIKEVLSQLLEAINYLHDKKIAHRDLKPANIFISNKHAFKIGDFGCSIYGQPNDFVGTLDYVAPQIMLHECHGVSVDMWQIGCIAFDLYMGYPPFYHPKRKQTIQNIIDCKFESQVIEDAKLRDLINKLLQRTPEKRLTAKQAIQHPFIS